MEETHEVLCSFKAVHLRRRDKKKTFSALCFRVELYAHVNLFNRVEAVSLLLLLLLFLSFLVTKKI